jgi:taurine dioxygenase
MQIRPLGETTGAEVTGIDLRQPLDAAARAELKAALLERVALVFRDQDLTPPQLAEAVRMFGEFKRERYKSEFGIPESPHVTEVSNKARDREGNRVMHGRIWHTDDADEIDPPNYTVLYAVEVPEKGGDTAVLNTRAGYASLPEEMRHQLDTMRVIPLKSAGRARLADSNKAFIFDAAERYQEGNHHPLVREHPETGENAIYFHAVKTDHIEGLTPEETKEVLRDILDRIERPEFIYRHQWRKGDLLIWDNRCALHQAFFDYPEAATRLLHRVILAGTRPYGPAMPQEEFAAAE